MEEEAESGCLVPEAFTLEVISDRKVDSERDGSWVSRGKMGYRLDATIGEDSQRNRARAER